MLISCSGSGEGVRIALIPKSFFGLEGRGGSALTSRSPFEVGSGEGGGATLMPKSFF